MVAKKILDVVSDAVIGAAKTTFEDICKATFSEPPTAEVKPLIEYQGKLRVSGMEKFNGPTLVSFANFYLNETDQKASKACGAIILYLEHDAAPKLLKGLKGSSFDEDDEATLFQILGELTTVFSQNFKNEIGRQGYADLIISAPANFLNIVPGGIGFSYDQYDKVEVSFYLWKKKAVVAEVTLTQIPGK